MQQNEKLLEKSSSRIQGIFNSIATRYEITNFVLSAGIYLQWQSVLFKCLDKLIPNAKEKNALDLCTGTGALLPALAKRFKRVVGVDFSGAMLEVAAKQLKKKGIAGVSLVEADALKTPLEAGSFDLVTVAYGVRNMASLEAGLQEIERVLSPDGALLILEFGQPKNFLWRNLYFAYSKCVLPILGGLLTGNFSAYKYLQQSSKAFPCGENLISVLEKAGLKDCGFKSLSFGIAYVYWAKKK